jgi:hypothetical protein
VVVVETTGGGRTLVDSSVVVVRVTRSGLPPQSASIRVPVSIVPTATSRRVDVIVIMFFTP